MPSLRPPSRGTTGIIVGFCGLYFCFLFVCAFGVAPAAGGVLPWAARMIPRVSPCFYEVSCFVARRACTCSPRMASFVCRAPCSPQRPAVTYIASAISLMHAQYLPCPSSITSWYDIEYCAGKILCQSVEDVLRVERTMLMSRLLKAASFYVSRLPCPCLTCCI